MKFTNSIALTMASAGTLAAAHGGHGHARFHRRAAETEVNTVAVPGPTVYDFVVMDPQHSGSPEPISNKDACAGLADHKLEWLDSAVPAACPTSSSTSTPTQTPTPTATATPTPQVLEQTSAVISPSSSPSSSSTEEPTTSSSSTSTPVAVPTSSASSSGSGGSTDFSGKGVDREFPDGEIDCDTFPSEYGAIALDYLKLGGWSGIQYLTILDGIIEKIETAVHGNICRNGGMCSYACPAGYQKAQWPSKQGTNLESIGGLECKDGKLHRTNKDSKTLCIEGNGGVNVQNKMDKQVAVCRTDYPGTESETIPLLAAPGKTQPLTCPNSKTYFKWNNKDTTAQYYVNNKGVSTEDGCQWGTKDKDMGNFAPMNLGVGFNGQETFLSMFKNRPTTNANLDFKIKIVGEGLSDSCMYDGKGIFHNDAGPIDDKVGGCTVGFSSGTAHYVFYENDDE